MRSLFRYTQQEKRGIFFLLLLISMLQTAVYLTKSKPDNKSDPILEADSLALAFLDSVKLAAESSVKEQLWPFNPNFISDYKGYVLGMSPGELDRLYTFRKENRYVRTAAEFQQVTGISDSLLAEIGPFFRFPVFSEDNRQQKAGIGGKASPRDLNTATEEELRIISGIGPVLSSRIVRFREKLGGFLVKEQLLDVYGLDEEVARRAMIVFEVAQIPEIQKVDINSASADEMARLVYIDYRLARLIVAYRNTHGRFDSIEQLTKIEDFPSERIDRIKLYLAL
jgi:competence ComEA-like helix-hairpin-helix protein